MSRMSFAGAMAAAGLLAWAATASAQDAAPPQPQPSPPEVQDSRSPALQPPVAQDVPAQPPPTANTAATTAYTDQQLSAFAAASVQIEPLNQQLAAAAPDARAPIGRQIVATLEQHGLDLETYNGIVAAAQADPSLAARVTALRQQAHPPG